MENIKEQQTNEKVIVVDKMKNAKNTFEVGKTYWTRSVCDSECVITITVAKRTAKFLTTTEGKRLGISIWDGVEHVKPWGTYSMAPIIPANRVVVGAKLAGRIMTRYENLQTGTNSAINYDRRLSPVVDDQYEEWYAKFEDSINTELAETGADREMDFDIEREFEKRYEKYLNAR